MCLKQKIKKTDIGITVIIIIGILAVINFFSYQIFYRWDLTQNKDYSISKVSKRTVSKLDDIINIKVYFSKELPSQYITLRQEVGDILDEYQNFSNNNIRIEFIDPKDNEEIEREISIIGIPELQFNVLEKDKYQVVRGYLGMAVQYGDKTEVIPVIQSTFNLEYQITLAIKKVTGQISAIIGFVTSNNTAGLDSEISVAYGKIQELYSVQEVDLETTQEVPNEIDTLIIAGPKGEFSQDQLKVIDAFLMQGKSLLVLIDGVKIEEGLIAIKNETNLNNLLESYGIKLNQDLVSDVINGMASFSQGFITFSTSYPFWPKVVKEGLAQDNPAVAKLESIIFPWASSLEILNEKIDPAYTEGNGNNISYLAKTTNKAKKQIDNFNIAPNQGLALSGESGQFNLAIAMSGKFNSPYSENITEAGRLIVVGDSDFTKNGFISNSADNLVFFQNLVDSLSLDEDLINIRSKGVTSRPIKELSENAKIAIRYSNIFALTVVVILFGMFRYYIRRRSRFVDEI